MTAFRRRTDESRFLYDGIDYKAKILGETIVPQARGERMCHAALKNLKAQVRSSGKHKQRVIINISTDGVKVKDEKTEDELQHHRITHISFIGHDPTDSRAFALVSTSQSGGSGGEKHVLHGFKTEKNATNVTGTIKELFQLVYKYKKEVNREKATNQNSNSNQPGSSTTLPARFSQSQPQPQPKPQPKSQPQPQPLAANPDLEGNSRHTDQSTNEDIFSDLATVRAQMTQQKLAPPSGQSQPQSEKTANDTLFDVAFDSAGTGPEPAKKADVGLIQSLGDDLFGDNLYQVPSNRPAGNQATGNLFQSTSVNEWNEMSSGFDQISQKFGSQKSNTPPFPLSSIPATTDDPFAPSTSSRSSSFSSSAAPASFNQLPTASASSDAFGSSIFGAPTLPAPSQSADPFSRSPAPTLKASNAPKDPFSNNSGSQKSDDRFAALRVLAEEDAQRSNDPFGTSDPADPFEFGTKKPAAGLDPFAASQSGASDPFGSSFESQPPATASNSSKDPFAAFSVLSSTQPNAASNPPTSDPFSSQGGSNLFGSDTMFQPSSQNNINPFAATSEKTTSTSNQSFGQNDPFQSATTDNFFSGAAPAASQIPSIENDPFAAFDSPTQRRRSSPPPLATDPSPLMKAPDPFNASSGSTSSTNPFASGVASLPSPVNPFAQFQQSSSAGNQQQQQPNPFATFSDQNIFGSSGFG